MGLGPQENVCFLGVEKYSDFLCVFGQPVCIPRRHVVYVNYFTNLLSTVVRTVMSVVICSACLDKIISNCMNDSSYVLFTGRPFFLSSRYICKVNACCWSRRCKAWSYTSPQCRHSPGCVLATVHFTHLGLHAQYPLVWKKAWHLSHYGVSFCFWWGGSVWTLMFCSYWMWYISLLLSAGSIFKKKKKKSDNDFPVTLSLMFQRFLILRPVLWISVTNSCCTEWCTAL
jgi:hypothetical protein